ncbi:hypothetical protein H0H81_005309 [Sphagnurus paluster]|uniref:Rad21/Rec8-like protein N-terminal domain-containing protein n=1 Tax=Sphagnurus paluster TaxID=117069 RepID=A0A9P7G1P3_9AGAR|nr:hypothetical protein H0H81_005309 [Sphagnurus paluster]
MFFTPELLSKRDSGFGLLLAATLGSKSTFKKLPKRSILTADIKQLCDLIAEPSEPLALRLSSNLLVGVARPSVVTLTANPKTMIAVDFDALVAVSRLLIYCSLEEAQARQDWDDYLNIREHTREEETGDDDFDPKALQLKKKKAQPPSQTEHGRAEMYTLMEHHDHLLSASFDLSFQGNGGAVLSSSQGANFGFEDNLFKASDGLDFGDLADELAQELGWKNASAKSSELAGAGFGGSAVDLGLNFNFGELSNIHQVKFTDYETDLGRKVDRGLKRKVSFVFHRTLAVF